MKKMYYPRLDETVLSETLECGLRVMVMPKQGFTRKKAYFITDFGAVHTQFALEGKEYTAPTENCRFRITLPPHSAAVGCTLMIKGSETEPVKLPRPVITASPVPGLSLSI